MEIPEGIFVFTSDKREVGTATNVDHREMKVAMRDVEATVTIPLSVADRIDSGRLLLSLDAGQFRHQFLSGMSSEVQQWGANNEEAVTDDHVSLEATEVFWQRLRERSWKALHDLAHQVSDDDGVDIPPAVISDVVLVARHLQDSNEPFPGSASELCDALNRHAAVLPHETSGN